MIRDHTTSSLTLTHCDWSLRVLSEGKLPGWKGSLIRGVLGWGLVDVGSAAPAPAWPGCQGSFADAVFNPQTAWNSPRAAPAWSLEVYPSASGINVGDTINGRMILIGQWPEWAIALMQEAFHAAAARGLGEQRLPAELAHWEITPCDLPQPPSDVAGIHLRTRSPCKLQESGKDLQELQPAVIARGLLRRLRALSVQLLDDDPFAEDDLGTRYHQAASLLETRHLDCRRRNLARHSAHQKRKHPMPAIEGSLTLSAADFQPWAPLFAWAPVLHIGRQANFGLGAVDLTWLSAAELQPPTHAPAATAANDHPARETEDLVRNGPWSPYTSLSTQSKELS